MRARIGLLEVALFDFTIQTFARMAGSYGFLSPAWRAPTAFLAPA
jgi:hypothetical protein